jgi:predicted DCC family thiol-disulfide oxidoreductase YuxK
VAFQQPGIQARTGVTDAEADRAAWTVLDGRQGLDGLDGGTDGRKVGGARAIGLALEVGRNATWPTLAWRVPGLPWMLDRIYDLIAKNRRRLPGETPWCETHPDQCVPTAP